MAAASSAAGCSRTAVLYAALEEPLAAEPGDGVVTVPLLRHRCRFVTPLVAAAGCCGLLGILGEPGHGLFAARGARRGSLRDALRRDDSGGRGEEKCAELYAQCGGRGWAGRTCCPRGSACKVVNDFWHQCDKGDPAAGADAAASSSAARSAAACRAAVSNDECDRAIRAGMADIAWHPDWYPGLLRSSTYKEWQEYFHWAKKHGCPKPCTPGSCDWIYRFEGCAAWEEWNCLGSTDDGSLAWDCCCKRHHGDPGFGATMQQSELAREALNTERAWQNVSLFCSALMLPRSYEVDLLRNQHSHGLGIFDCDDWAVYSNESIRISAVDFRPAELSVVMDGPLEAKRGGEYNTVLNTPVFIRYWNKLIEHGAAWAHDWVVKADPDTLFFPERLRGMLSGEEGGPLAMPAPITGRYLNNCHGGLHGPLEVFSIAALGNYQRHATRCTGGEPATHGQEDWYLRVCFRLLGVQQIDAFNLLFEGHWACQERPSSWHPRGPPCFSPQVAFHPFKTVDAMRHCLAEAELHPPTRPLTPYGRPPSKANQQHS